MRIFEITDKNLVWKSLAGLDFNFETEYNLVVKVCNILLKNKRRSQYKIGLNHINDFKIRAYKFLNLKPFGPTDPEIIKLISNVKKMLVHLSELENQLK